MAIVHDQQVVWARGFGFADAEKKTPATLDTLYRVASISKLFTATAVMQMRDAGKLRLDVRSPRTCPGSRSRPSTAGTPYWMDANFPDWHTVRARLGQQAQTLATDTRWKYSNLAVALAGEVVAAVSGEPWPDYVRRHILDPLG